MKFNVFGVRSREPKTSGIFGTFLPDRARYLLWHGRGVAKICHIVVLMVLLEVISWQEEGIVKAYAYACRLQTYAK